jgi:hypothetical protein
LIRKLHLVKRSLLLLVLIPAGLGLLLGATPAEQPGTGLKIGLGEATITPFFDTPLAGYYYPRMPVGVHDNLHAKALVLDNGSTQVVLVACDLVRVPREAVEAARSKIQAKFGIPPDHVLISAAHSHTGPVMTPEYTQMLGRWIADSVETAMHSKVDASLYRASAMEPTLPHNRRYLMKDGTVETNPGFLNPNVVKPVGPIDPRVAVLFATGPDGRPLMTWVNYALHQDTVGGDWISADFAYFLGRTLAKFEGPDMLTIFTIGAAGDINHWDLSKPGPQRGFPVADRIGTILGADVVKAYENLEPVSPRPIRAASQMLDLPLQKVTPQQVAEAKQIMASPPPPHVDFTLRRVNARKVVTISEHPSGVLPVEIQVVSVGPVAFVGIPGELFVQLGLEIQKESPFPDTVIVELANQDLGYIPTRLAFKQGGYEPTSCVLEPGGGEKITETAIAMLKRLRAGN